MADEGGNGFVIKIVASKDGEGGEVPWAVPAYVSHFDPHANTERVAWSPDRLRAHVFREREMAEAVVRLLLEDEHVAEIREGWGRPPC